MQLALKARIDVSFETNFHDSSILNVVREFKGAGFRTKLIFIGLDSVELAKERVNQRVNEGGHFVPELTIERRFNQGLELLDESVRSFDSIEIHQSLSGYTSKPVLILEGKDFLLLNHSVLIERLPRIKKLVSNQQDAG